MELSEHWCKGDNLFETMDNGMICLNQETKSRIKNIRQVSSNIDLIFNTQKIVDKINIKQGEDTWGSDHYPIHLKLEIEIHRYKKRTNKISTKKIT